MQNSPELTHSVNNEHLLLPAVPLDPGAGDEALPVLAVKLLVVGAGDSRSHKSLTVQWTAVPGVTEQRPRRGVALRRVLNRDLVPECILLSPKDSSKEGVRTLHFLTVTSHLLTNASDPHACSVLSDTLQPHGL